VPDRFEGRLRWLFGGVAVVLVTACAYALLVTAHPEPAQAGVDVATTSLRALAVLAMVTIASLGALVVRSPRRRTHLMPVLALASASALPVLMLGALRASAVEAPVTPFLGAGLLALLLSVASALGWLLLWLAPRPGAATVARDGALLNALLATIVPEGHGLDLAASDPEIRARIERAFGARGSARRPVLRVVLRVLDARAWLRHRRSFARLDQDAREALVAALATSRSERLRALGALVDEIVLASFYDDARVRRALADDVDWITERLDAGPNADAHRVRRDEAARAALAADAAASAHEEPAAEDAVDDAAFPAGSVDLAVGEHAARSPVVADAAQGEDDAQGEPGEVATEQTAVAVEQGGAARRVPEVPAPRAEDVPFDRPWTLGVPKEPSAPAAGATVLRVARPIGPTRP